jgi:hypothetical protein
MKVIRRLVEQQRITYTRHAFEVRMPKRGFDPGDVEKVLSRGSIEGKISAGRAVGEWQCLMVAKLELRGRDVGVAVIVRPGRVIVKTVEWIDP